MPSPTRVLFVIDELDIGGTEQQLLELVRRLDRQKYLPMVCCFRPGGSESLVRTGVRLGRVNLAFGDGSNRLPHVYVDNVVDAQMLAARSDTAYGRAYNIVDDEEVTQRMYAEQMRQALGVRQSTYYLPLSTVRLLATGADLARAALRGRRSPQGLFHRISRSLQSVRYDTSCAKKELAWRPRVSFEEALKRMREAKLS